MYNSTQLETIMLHIGAVTGKQFSIEVFPSDTVMDVKLRIFQESNLPPESQILVFNEKTLNDKATLEQNHISDGSKLSLMLQMSGGHGPSSRVKAQKSVEGELMILERILSALDGDTASKLLNLLDDKPEIMHVLFPEDKKEPDSSRSRTRSSFYDYCNAIDEQIEEDISSEEKSLKSSSSFLKMLDSAAVSKSTPNFKRPNSTQSIAFSLHTRASSITSLELVELLRKSESVQKIVSRASSGKIRLDRPNTSMALGPLTIDDISLAVAKSRPSTVKKSGIPVLKKGSSRNSLEKQESLAKTSNSIEARLKQLVLRAAQVPEPVVPQSLVSTTDIDKSIQEMKRNTERMKKDILDTIQSVKQRQLKEKQQRDKIEEEKLLKKKLEEEKLLKEKEEQKKLDEEKRLIQEKEKQEQLQEKQVKSDFDPKFASKEAFESYSTHVNRIRELKQQIQQQVQLNPQIQNQFFMRKMKITTRVGQLTNSVAKIKEIAVAIDQVFSEGKVFSQLMYEWLMDFCAKAIIKQAEKEVAVKRDTAFPLALVCVILYVKHNTFLDILLGRLEKKCSYVAGIYVKRKPGEADQEYMKSVGYKKNENGEFESEVQYGERMCGILSLYFAILQTQPANNVHGMDNAWIWISRVLNLKPRKITPLLITTFLQVAGNAFILRYRGQARKVLNLLISEYFALIPEKAIASKTRLQLFLEETFLKTGNIPLLEGSEINP